MRLRSCAGAAAVAFWFAFALASAFVLGRAAAASFTSAFDIWPDMYFPDDPQGIGACHRASPERSPTDAELVGCFLFARPRFEALRARLDAEPALVEVTTDPGDTAFGVPWWRRGPYLDAMRAIGAFSISGGGGQRVDLDIYRMGIVPSGMIASFVWSAVPLHEPDDRALGGAWYVEVERN